MPKNKAIYRLILKVIFIKKGEFLDSHIYKLCAYTIYQLKQNKNDFLL